MECVDRSEREKWKSHYSELSLEVKNREVLLFREVFFIHSKGNNSLIEAGACLVSSGETILKILNIFLKNFNLTV